MEMPSLSSKQKESVCEPYEIEAKSVLMSLHFTTPLNGWTARLPSPLWTMDPVSLSFRCIGRQQVLRGTWIRTSRNCRASFTEDQYSATVGKIAEICERERARAISGSMQRGDPEYPRVQ